MRVLVADDDPAYLSLIKSLLEKWQFEVVLASDGLTAWDLLQREDAPRLVILDWMMPGMDGFRLSRAIRNGRHGACTCILLITGSRNKKDILKVMVCGADDYLIKPFDPTDLMIRLRNAVRIINLEEELAELRQAPGPKPPACSTRQAVGPR